MIKGSLIGLCLLGMGIIAQAQDTSRRKSIDITSTFKPVLREAAKVNFNAAAPVIDTNRPRLTYNIPAENLFFTYQPAELKPVALEPDSGSIWSSDNFIKAGIGNVHQPYIRAGFSFGDRNNTFFNVFGNYFSSTGDLNLQKNNQTQVGAFVTHRTPGNLEWNGGAGFTSDDYYLYGTPDSLLFPKESLRQRFQTLEAKLGLRNMESTEFGISYNPSVRISYFADNHPNSAAEANTVVNLPVTKGFGERFNFRLGVTADLTNYRLDAATKFTQNNNIFMVSPALIVKEANFNLHAGLIPSWDQGSFHMLPDLMADITTNDQRFTLQVGWIGYYNKGSYQRFASINPWLAQPDSLLNTRVSEGYAGFKGSVGNHLSYSAKVGFQQHRNIPLFVNNYMGKHNFNIVYEPKLNIFQTHGEAQYSIGEKFNAKATFDWYRFSKQEKEEEAWGMIPLELSTSLRWQILNDLWFRTELWAFDGAQYKGADNRAYKGDGGFDLNAGAEFRLTRNFNVWFQMNNIFNNRYERWNRYEVFGFNILGGIVYNFRQ